MTFHLGEDLEGELYTYKDKVQFRIRAVPPEVIRELRAKYLRMKTGDVQNQPVAKSVDTSEAVIADKAAYALVDTVGFAVKVSNEEDAAALSKAAGVPYTAGESLLLDGKWDNVQHPAGKAPNALRLWVFGKAPVMAEWIVEKAKERAGLEAQEDAARDQDFR